VPPRTASRSRPLALVLLASACSSSEPDAAPATTQGATASATISEQVNLGDGRSIHLECTGAGSPTVVLQSGFGNAGDVWSVAEAHAPAVQPGLAATNRV